MPVIEPSPPPCSRTNFRVDLGAKRGTAGELGFSEVIFPDFEIDPGKDAAPLPTGRLILRRAITGEPDLYDWWHRARLGRSPRRRTVCVDLLSPDQQRVIQSWVFLQAVPVCLRYAPLLANESGIAMESIEIAFERMELR